MVTSALAIIACMLHRWSVFGQLKQEMQDAVAAYGPHDRGAVDALQPLVVLGIAAWGSLAPLIGETSPRTAQRLEWLRHKANRRYSCRIKSGAYLR